MSRLLVCCPSVLVASEEVLKAEEYSSCSQRGSTGRKLRDAAPSLWSRQGYQGIVEVSGNDRRER